MMDRQKIDDIATQVATANLTSKSVTSVSSAATTDSEGDPALKVTIVLTPGSTDTISGDAVIKTISELQQRLHEEGENRFPIVEFETEGEPVAD